MSKWNIELTWFALGFILINFFFYLHASSMNGGGSMIYIFIFPSFWILTLLILALWGYNQRHCWFKENLRTSSFILLFFCTPIPLFVFSSLIRPEMYCSGTGYNSKNGFTIKDETWNFNNGNTAIIKYWKINIENYRGNGDDDRFIKDSTWIYFKKNGDTLKTETYKDNQLIKTNTIKDLY